MNNLTEGACTVLLDSFRMMFTGHDHVIIEYARNKVVSMLQVLYVQDVIDGEAFSRAHDAACDCAYRNKARINQETQ